MMEVANDNLPARFQQLPRLESLVGHTAITFLDTNFLTVESRLSEELFRPRTVLQLGSVFPQMENTLAYFNWLTNFIRQDRVYTIPEVVKEFNELYRHLSLTNAYFTRQLATLKADYISLDTSSTKQKALARRENRLRDKVRLGAEYYFSDTFLAFAGRRSIPAALSALNRLTESVRQIRKNLHIYTTAPEPFLPRYPDISETDHRLVEAAVNYAYNHCREEVLVLSDDKHVHFLLSGTCRHYNWPADYGPGAFRFGRCYELSTVNNSANN